jgi:hypothetical protein
VSPLEGWVRILNQILKVVVIVGLWSGVVAQAPKELSLQQLYERHSWFELRDAIAGRAVHPLYSGAVASAFKRPRDAENVLKRAVREASNLTAARALVKRW